VCVCVYIYIYIHIHMYRPRANENTTRTRFSRRATVPLCGVRCRASRELVGWLCSHSHGDDTRGEGRKQISNESVAPLPTCIVPGRLCSHAHGLSLTPTPGEEAVVAPRRTVQEGASADKGVTKVKGYTEYTRGFRLLTGLPPGSP